MHFKYLKKLNKKPAPLNWLFDASPLAYIRYEHFEYIFSLFLNSDFNIRHYSANASRYSRALRISFLSPCPPSSYKSANFE